MSDLLERAEETHGSAHLYDALRSFRCCRDEDIEHFLQEKAVEFLRRNWCPVYLLVDEQAFDAGRIKIDAYFTLSHKTLIPAAASKTTIKDASGFKSSQSIHFVLIGQLGKYMVRAEDQSVLAADISSEEILDRALEIVQMASALIPCRCVLVECSDNEKVHKVYTDYGFKFFQFDGEHHQFYRQV